MIDRYTEFRCSSLATAEVRQETLEGRSYLVVPVIALIGNSVIQASNAATPEFVPSDVIEKSLFSWNSRPALPLHPKQNGKHISANNPAVYDSSRMGLLFNTRFEDDKLKTEAWLDIDRCQLLGGNAQAAIDKINLGETIDVSVGAMVQTEDVPGVMSNGTVYGASWVNVVGDHLALLPYSEGACNQEMGCGAPRAAESIESKGANMSTPVAVDSPKPAQRETFFSKLLSKFRPAVIFDDGESDSDLKETLSTALKSIEPAFDWIVCVYPDSKVVIYMTYVVYSGSYYGVYKYWRRTYELSEDGKVATLNNDAIEVTPKRVWETVGAELGENGNVIEAVIAAESSAPVTEIRAAECTCTTNNQKGAENMSEPTKQAAGAVETPAVEPTSTPTPATPTPTSVALSAAPTALTEEQALAACPSLRSMVTKYKAAEAARKLDLVSRLTGAQKVFDQPALEAKSLEELEEVAALVGLESSQIDFSLRGMPESRAASISPSTAPDGYLIALGKATQAN